LHGRQLISEEVSMPRYMVERTFPTGLAIPINADGEAVVQKVVDVNAEHGVTWVRSYVTEDKTRTFCVYDGPSPDAIRTVAERNGLPVDGVTPITVLDPYFYR
jgi:hypothetical protein